MQMRMAQVSGLTSAQMRTVMNAIGENWLPAVSSEPGFLGYSIFGNPDSGKGGMVTLWSSQRALVKSEAVERKLYEAAMSAIGYKRDLIVDRYELLGWEAPTMEERQEQPI
jgi:hypothetical protein